jgi:probable phosphoglycerate mutase
LTDSPPALPRAAFWFLRHGETDWNARGLSQGNIDIPLNANGLAQARTAAELLRDRRIASIVASPLSRARITAEIAAEVAAVPVAIDPDLVETSFGAQDGQPMTAWFDDWIAGTFTPPDAEPFAALRARAIAAITRALGHPAPVLVVGHGAFFRALRAEMGLVPNVRLPNAMPMLCTPPPDGAAAWTLTPAAEVPR